MTPEELARVKTAHARALLLSEEQRAAFLRQQFDGAPQSLDQAQQLLAWHDQAGEFLRTPLAGRMFGNDPGDFETRRVGPYELIRKLGFGGSATVYLARRADDLFEKHVAVKLLNRLAHSEEVFRRFQREVQVLARVEHPYIVRLLEAGATGEALSYIVTEFVNGVRIDEFATNLQLTEKLGLFLKVCEGVASAHRALVVHRDLKPSNILVTADGTPKILDFGIALLLDHDWQLTRTGMERMTVCYASPEQMRGEKTITTSSDVYSLGVLFYRLLAGRVPFDYPEHEIAARMAAEDPAPVRGMPRELMAIARKALQHEPGRRYESVDRFRDDVGNFLAGSPVEAHGDSAAYRLQKFTRRHWLPIAGLSVTFLALGVLSILSIASSREARRQSARVRELLFESFSNSILDPTHWTSLRVRRQVLRARLPYLDSLAAEYPDDREIGLQRFNGWRAAGNTEGLPSTLNLGETEQARRTMERAVNIGDTLLARGGWPSEFRRDVAVTHIELGSVLIDMDEVDQAQREFARAHELSAEARVDLESLAQQSRILSLRGRNEEALQIRQRVAQDRRRLYEANPAMRWEFAGALCSYGELLRQMGRFAEAERSYAEALPMIEELASGSRLGLENFWHLARESDQYARVLLQMGRKADARKHLERAIELYREIRKQEPDALSNQRALALSLALLGRELLKSAGAERGRRLLDEALQISEAAAQQDPASKRALDELTAVRRTRAGIGDAVFF